jgi:hypothetical protein
MLGGEDARKRGVKRRGHRVAEKRRRGVARVLSNINSGDEEERSRSGCLQNVEKR